MRYTSPVTIAFDTCKCERHSSVWTLLAPTLLLILLFMPLWYIVGQDEFDLMLFTERKKLSSNT